MSINFVGKEALPNAYIKNIEINKKGKDFFSLTVKTNVYDFLNEDGETSWFNTSNIITKNMRIGIVFCRNEEEAMSLADGTLSPLSTLLENRRDTRLVASYKPDNLNFINTFTREFPNNTEYMSIFVFCFIKSSEVYQTTGTQIPDILGPIKSEKIFDKGRIFSRTHVFTKPDGSLYSGPVHRHNDGFMEGARHTENPHSALQRQIITNFKIKDNRDKIAETSVSLKTKANMISELFSSYDDNTNINSVFFMNREAILKRKTKYGNFLNRASKEVLKQILSDFKLKTFNIQRLRIKSNMRGGSFRTKKQVTDVVFSRKNIVKAHDSNGKLVNHTRLERSFSYDVIEEELPSSNSVQVPKKGQIYQEQISHYKKVSKVRELFLDYGDQLRCFEFIDMGLTDKIPGKYKYKLEVSFADPTYAFLEKVTLDMKTALSNVKTYENFISRRINYNFVTSETNFTSYAGVDLNSLVAAYVMYYSYIYNTTPADTEQMSYKLYSLINPASASTASVRKFREKFSALYTEYLRFLDVRGNRSHFNSVKVNPRQNAQTSRILLTHEFSQIFEPSKNFSSVSYFGRQQRQGMKSFTKRQIIERSERETSKHYKGSPRTSSPAINNIRDSALTHYTPAFIKSGKSILEVATANTVDVSNFNRFIKGKDNKRNKVFLDFLIIDKKQKTSEDNIVDDDERFLESREILGSGHEFVSYSNLTEPYKSPKVASKAKSIFFDDKKELTGAKRSLKTLDKKAAIMTEEQRNKLPLQIKALIARNDQNTNNILSAVKTDLLASPTTKDYYEINNLSVQKMSFINGFQQDESGDVFLNKPIYVDMDINSFTNLNRSVLGSLDPYSNNSLSIDGNLGLSVMDSFFILSDKDITSVPQNVPLDSVVPAYLNSNIQYQYTDSVIVVQPPYTYNLQQVSMMIRDVEKPAQIPSPDRVEEIPAVAQMEPAVYFQNESDSENRVKIYLSLKFGSKSADFIPIQANEGQIFLEKPRNSNGKYNFAYSKEEGKFEVFKLNKRPSSYLEFRDNKVLDVRNNRSSTSVVFYDNVLPGRKYYYTFRAINLQGVPSNPTAVYEVELIKMSSGSKIQVKVIDFDEKKTIYHDKRFKNLLQIKPAFQQEVFDDQSPEVAQLESFKQNIELLTLGIARDKLWGKKFKIRIKSKDTGKIIDLNIKFNLNKEKRPEDF